MYFNQHGNLVKVSFIIEKALSCEYLIVSPFLFVNVMIVFVFSKDFLSTNLFEVIEFEVRVIKFKLLIICFLVTLLLSNMYRILFV